MQRQAQNPAEPLHLQGRHSRRSLPPAPDTDFALIRGSLEHAPESGLHSLAHSLASGRREREADLFTSQDQREDLL
jgi:hypothetical protein